ncbi:MAG: SDR family NAD(P)-dependent oxidoreductase, partial [Alphaproteobacteria bacterium]|nr:SDR family NAD(P)-dependent oxidoreductase [Alphaproteobacteria bacterium]
RGMRVIATGRDMARLQAVQDALGDLVFPFVLDVTDAVAVAALPGSLPAELRQVDVLINNAGHDVGGRRAFHDGAAHEWDSIIETNVGGLMRVSSALAPGMVERGQGHIINMGSTSGLYTYAGGAAYNASKFAVHGFTEALRKDYAATDIRVTEILPGMVRTNFAATRLKGDEKGGDAYYDNAAACLLPEDIAAGVLYALDQPPHVNISQLVIEPTRTAQ